MEGGNQEEDTGAGEVEAIGAEEQSKDEKKLRHVTLKPRYTKKQVAKMRKEAKKLEKEVHKVVKDLFEKTGTPSMFLTWRPDEGRLCGVGTGFFQDFINDPRVQERARLHMAGKELELSKKLE